MYRPTKLNYQAVLTLHVRPFIVGLDAPNHQSGSSQPSHILQAVDVQRLPRKIFRTIDTSEARIKAIAEPPSCAIRYCTGSGRFLIVVTIVAGKIHSILL